VVNIKVCDSHTEGIGDQLYLVVGLFDDLLTFNLLSQGKFDGDLLGFLQQKTNI